MESRRHPDGIQAPCARAPRATQSHTQSPYQPAAAATATVDVAAAAAEKALRERGIVEPQRLMEFASPDAILGVCRWYDEQNGRVGTGVLVNEIRAGGKPGYSGAKQKSLLQREAEYGDRVVAWLRENFPDVAQHPAAFAAVLRLHHRHGKGRLTKREHGPEIRAAVKRWNSEYEREVPS